jgi:thioester reductase-like protein
VVLRRLEDALADGDAIRGVIRGTAINNSGTVAAGFTTPNAGAQEQAAIEALATADVTADSIGYLELHGSGTAIGDAIEVRALSRAYGKATVAKGHCGIGAVKSYFGHLGPAAGMASLCKTVLAVEHGEIPPTILVERVNPDLGIEQTPFHLVLQPEGWRPDAPRRAAVNSYGVGGTNAHLVLEQAPEVGAHPATAGPYVLVLSARTPSALRAASDRLASHLRRRPDLDLADVAFTLATGRSALHHRRALVCRDVTDAIDQLQGDNGTGVRETHPPDATSALASLTHGGSGDRAGALKALAAAWVRGATLDWRSLFGEGRRRVALPSYPFERRQHWIAPPMTDAGGAATPAVPAFVSSGAAAAVKPVRHEEFGTPPTSPLEEIVCGLWRSATGVSDAGIDDNFFALGGTSLQLAEVHARLRATVVADLTVVDVFMNPTVRTLVQQIERIVADPSVAGQLAPGVGGLPGAPAGRLAPWEIDRLRADTRLADDIRPAPGATATVTPENILLTGATGFLGVFLLNEVIARTGATIYCHVRASTPAAALERLKAAMAARALWAPTHAARIVPVLGDLGEPRLGLAPDVYADLVDRIDTIVHNGALVNFTPPYATLRPINVVGTEDVLRVACSGRSKTLHFVSSTGVWAGRFPVAEDDPLDEIDRLENGYTQTKWVAERLVQAAADRGLPVTIHRPPRVVGDSRTGTANLDDFVARAIKGCAELGAAPHGHFFDILSPVDFVARAIVAIALSPGATTLQRFHIVHPKLSTWRTILDYMPGAGIPLEMLPYEEWRLRLIRHCQDHDNALKPLLPLFRAADAGGYAEIPSDADLSALPDVPCDNATTLLERAGISCPPIDAALLDIYFRYFFEAGYLARPA